MATHNFQIFDESMTDMMTDIDYQSDSQRTTGVVPGLADPLLHNKLYRQCSVMAYAIAQAIVARGYNADDSDPVALTNAIQRAFAFSVNGNVPNASGAITAFRPLDAWPVGSVFITLSSTNPATLLGGGTWTQIKGKYLLAADTGDTVDGTTTYGAMTKDVPLVAHTHTFTTASAGSHTHSVSGTTGAAGSHSHTRGTMNITGYHGLDDRAFAQIGGAFSKGATSGALGAGGSDYGAVCDFDASKSWTGSTSTASNHTHSISVTTASDGAHTHTGTTASSGTSAAFDVRPLSIAVYMWRRTA